MTHGHVFCSFPTRCMAHSPKKKDKDSINHWNFRVRSIPAIMWSGFSLYCGKTLHSLLLICMQSKAPLLSWTRVDPSSSHETPGFFLKNGLNPPSYHQVH
jgi:hypothetical protein